MMNFVRCFNLHMSFYLVDFQNFIRFKDVLHFKILFNASYNDSLVVFVQRSMQ